MRFLFAGDFYPCTDKSKRIIKDGLYKSVIKEVVPYTSEADFSIVNFESPIVDDENRHPFIAKGTRNLCSDKSVLECIKEAGFSMVALANNHFHDYGDIGVKQTFDACNALEIPYCGAGLNLKDAQVVKQVMVMGRKISIINFCENEFSVATSKSAGSNPFNLVDIVHQIKEVRQDSDYVILFVHGGVEHYQLPTPLMVKNYRFFVESGADMVINSHQHCFNGYEYYQGKPIVYGLGNFFFDNGASEVSKWNEGYMVMIEDKDGAYTISPIPYIQGMSDLTIRILQDKGVFLQRINAINQIIQQPEELEKEFVNFVEKQMRSLMQQYEPYSSRIALKLYRMKLLPSLLTKKKRVRLLNRLRCEAHQQVYAKMLALSLKMPF